MGTELTKVTFPDTNYIDLNHRVSNVAWDSTNKKLTQTLGKTTTDIVTGETILDPLIPVKTAEGSLVSFSDGADLPMPSFICNIDAVQDLHGYDGPWVGGAGKNKLNITASGFTAKGITFTVNSDGSVTVNGTSTENNVFFNLNYTPNKSFLQKGVAYKAVVTTTDSNVRLQIAGNGSPNIIATCDGGDVEFTIPSDYSGDSFWARIQILKAGTTVNNAVIVPMVVLATETDLTFAPYSNICPISGHTGLDAWVSGKNLFNLNPISFPYTYNEIAVSNNNGAIILDGTVTGGEFLFPDGNNLNQTIYKYLKPSTTYVFSTGYSNKNMGLQVFYRETAGASWKKLAETYYRENITFTTPASYAVIWVRVQFVKSAVINNVTLYPMIRLATEQDTTYEPFNPNSQTISVSWQTEAGEVFDGYVDLVSGKMTVTHKSQTGFTRGSQDSSNKLYNIGTISDMKKFINTNYISPYFIDSMFEKMSVPSAKAAETPSITQSNRTLFVGGYIGKETELDTLLESLQVKYELETPITFQLTPTQIKSLLGNNNAWASTGNVNVKYITQPYDGISAKYSEYAYNAVNKTGDTMTGRLATKKPINQIITGTGIQGEDKGSGQSPRYFPSTWKFNTGLTAINGDIFTIQIPVAGYSTGVWMSVDNGTTYYPIATQGTTRLQTQYGINTLMTVIFEANGSVETYPKDGGNSAITVTGGIFRVLNFYDSNTNTQMRVYRQNSGYNSDYPLLASRSLASAIGKAGSNGSYSAIYGVMWDDTTKIPTLNPSTGEVKAYSLTVGTRNGTVGTNSFIQGSNNTGSGAYSHAEGSGTTATADYSHSEGYLTYTNGACSHAEGASAYTGGTFAHAEGGSTSAIGSYSHAEGNQTKANAAGCHTEGYATYATTAATYAHVEGAGSSATYNTAHAEGYYTLSSGNSSHSEGEYTYATTDGSHAEGYKTTAFKKYSHAEGQYSYASKDTAHAEGYHTFASGDTSHAEGYYTTSASSYAHSEGNFTKALANSAHAEGYYTTSNGDYAHSEGEYTLSSGSASHTEGNGSYAKNTGSHAEGYRTTASSAYDHSEGYTSYASGGGAHSEGYATYATGSYSHSEGENTCASGGKAHAEGSGTTASSTCSHSEGTSTYASGARSHAEGVSTTAAGANSHSEGAATRAVVDNSHAEGYYTTAYGNYSHVEGQYTYTLGSGAHAEGYQTSANGSYSHAEGRDNLTYGNGSHAEGEHSYALGYYAHTNGQYTTATHRSQHVFGEYNALDASTKANSERGNYIEIVGNGTASTALSNARTLDWDGTESLAGGIKIQGNFTQYSNHIDLTKSNNDITSNNYRYVSFVDKNNKYCGYFESQVRTDGSVATGFYCRNYKTDGTAVTNGMASSVAKNGVITWSVQEAAKFRTAIGAAASSSYLTKTNIKDIDDKEALKILNVKVKSFDYKPGFVVDSDVKNKYYGIIAEDIKDEIPYVVNIPKNYSEETFDESLGLQQDLITVDYVNFIPYLIRTIQLQDKRIKELELKLNK